MHIALAAALLAAPGDFIDRVQPDCGVLRAFATRQAEQLKITEDLARFSKDPAERKSLEAEAEKLRPSALEQQKKYEQCRDTAPKVMSEEQARREEEQAQQDELQRMIERRNHPPGAIAPPPRHVDPPPPPPPQSAEELRWSAQKQAVLADPRQHKLLRIAWTCWDAGGRYSELQEQKDPQQIARLRGIGCYRVKALMRCLDRAWAKGEQFRPGDTCTRPLERTAIEQQ